MKRALSLIIVIIFLFTSKYIVQGLYDSGFYERRQDIELFFLPSLESSRIISFGFDNVYSNYIFIRSLSYFLDHFKENKDYEYLEHQYYLITGLDPYFTRAYTFGALTFFIAFNSYEKPIELLMKGHSFMPSNYRIIQDIAFFHYQFKNYGQAAEWYLKASQLEGIPRQTRERFLRLYYTSLELKGDISMAKHLWFDLYIHSEDDITKELAARRLYLLYEVENIKKIAEAIDIYNSFNQENPFSLEYLSGMHYADFSTFNLLYPQKQYTYSKTLGNILVDYLLIDDLSEYDIYLSFDQIYPFYDFPDRDTLYQNLKRKIDLNQGS